MLVRLSYSKLLFRELCSRKGENRSLRLQNVRKGLGYSMLGYVERHR